MNQLIMKRAYILDSEHIYLETKEIRDSINLAWSNLYENLSHDRTVCFLDVEKEKVKVNARTNSISDMVKTLNSYKDWHKQH